MGSDDQKKARQPRHPATVVQQREAPFGVPKVLTPHPATVVQRRDALPRHPATVLQRRETPIGMPKAKTPHPATVVQRRETLLGVPKAPAPHPATVVAQRRPHPAVIERHVAPPRPHPLRKGRLAQPMLESHENPAAPPFEPDVWNDQEIANRVNCYAYSMNFKGVEGGELPQPGEYDSLDNALEYTASALTTLVLKDGSGQGVSAVDRTQDDAANKRTPPNRENHYLVAMVLSPRRDESTVEAEGTVTVVKYNSDYEELSRTETTKTVTATIDRSPDYHFYRQNPNGTWSHKPGTDDVTNKDSEGELINNPETCARAYQPIKVYPKTSRATVTNEDGTHTETITTTPSFTEVNYSVFAGYFYVPKGGIKVGAR